MTILYIDDDVDDCDLMVEALQELDGSIHCITYTESIKGLKFLMEASELPDFIILDINMPQLNGKDCLIKIKEQERLKYIPVVMCSTTLQTKEIKTYFELGAYDFIVKPSTISKFCMELDSIIKSLHKDHES